MIHRHPGAAHHKPTTTGERRPEYVHDDVGSLVDNLGGSRVAEALLHPENADALLHGRAVTHHGDRSKLVVDAGTYARIDEAMEERMAAFKSPPTEEPATPDASLDTSPQADHSASTSSASPSVAEPARSEDDAKLKIASNEASRSTGHEDSFFNEEDFPAPSQPAPSTPRVPIVASSHGMMPGGAGVKQRAVFEVGVAKKELASLQAEVEKYCDLGDIETLDGAHVGKEREIRWLQDYIEEFTDYNENAKDAVMFRTLQQYLAYRNTNYWTFVSDWPSKCPFPEPQRPNAKTRWSGSTVALQSKLKGAKRVLTGESILGLKDEMVKQKRHEEKHEGAVRALIAK